MSTIKIRPASQEDIPYIYGLVKELAEYEKEPEAVTATLEDYHKDFKDGIFRANVAIEEDQVVGMTLYFIAYSTWKGKMFYLDDFVVSQEHRRKGIGQLLFNYLIAQSKEEGAKMIKWQVLDWNKPAVAFYEKNEATIEEGWWNVKIIF